MGKTYFVTGTDTDAGKTVITCGLLEAARLTGLTTLALKPVSAGCHQSENGLNSALRNQDALALMEAMTLSLPYEQVNPLALEPPVAPHIAAAEAGVCITLDRLVGYCRGALMHKSDLALIEGAGGWRVPLNSREMISGLAKALNTPAILVVGMKLGCISQALLTAEAILRDGVKLAGWVANQIDPGMSRYEENFQTLKNLIPAPCLGVVPFLSDTSSGRVAGYLDISPLVAIK
ncbi:dethiobiotin synthase [Endozoicomonas sp. SCSIO W0465]|uniref:dethiobiotin synthase n=1 Tax=Endozoicomonas sp. SCSIO W0465 TaxID=2918516 RepID=UPI0020756653|nr:dethiobiotin synthase [Endozoicomonas sp. SCSIO W0465]USE36980.1 dethiobiotin synthase [Endozoicomonas sp. SCSIO W0465]